MRILLAEDEKALSKAIMKIFEKNNCSADAVYDGEEALAYLETGNYDVAVLDIMMPEMDGITVLKKIRSEGNRIPVLILTAKSEIEDRVAGLDGGANDYLPKGSAKVTSIFADPSYIALNVITPSGTRSGSSPLRNRKPCRNS